VAGTPVVAQMSREGEGNPGFLIGVDHDRSVLRPVDGGVSGKVKSENRLSRTSQANRNMAVFISDYNEDADTHRKY
jgi:hypothetical protein